MSEGVRSGVADARVGAEGSRMSREMKVAGADGCRGGWVVVALKEGAVEAALVPDARALGTVALELDVMAVDIPIGLPDSGPRHCDLEVRGLLGHPRASSVFPPPARPVLESGELGYAETCTLSRRVTGKGISRQTYAILPKIREMDTLLRTSLALRGRIREMHPEVSFCFWNGMRPMQGGKKKREGRKERWALVEQVFPGGYGRARTAIRRSSAADDDILDTFAACWTASRIATGESTTFPATLEHDSRGLPMEIVA